MNPTELRIGNYVRLRDSGEIVKVEALSRKKIRFFHGNDKSRPYFRKYSEIEPVLIWDVKDKFKHPHQLSWADRDVNKEMYYYLLCGDYIPITDLHELQNIHFAFTGNEIEIEP